uniref:Serine/threonine-protein phosphatase 2A activator n=1 Tax=Setaria digitata TaxID=48799 RepID=A0A915PL99_9BILA
MTVLHASEYITSMGAPLFTCAQTHARAHADAQRDTHGRDVPWKDMVPYSIDLKMYNDVERAYYDKRELETGTKLIRNWETLVTDAMIDGSGESDKNKYYRPERHVLSVFDLAKWCRSKAYAEYMGMVNELNDSVKGVVSTDDIPISPKVMDAIDILDELQKWTLEYPPEEMGTQRFGNVAFRKWYQRLTEESDDIIYGLLTAEKKNAVVELLPYFLDSFGNATRIDYGSGHEASFLIFMCCLRKLGVFTKTDNCSLVLRLFLKYLRLVRCLQTTYRMEPAGSRGVHALDDFQFIPFLWGSSQLIGNKRLSPESYLKPDIVKMHASRNLFFDAVQYINDTKIGPFHEHSNQLWNISAVQTWEKINSGMFKMYEAEVLKKFPVVQHFQFGSLFSIEPIERLDDPNLSDTKNDTVSSPLAEC